MHILGEKLVLKKAGWDLPVERPIHRQDCVLIATLLLLILILPSAFSATAKPHEVKDLHYGEVLFHFYQRDYFTAITHHLGFRDLDRVPNHVADSEVLLGGMLLSYGLHQEAGRIFRRILDEYAEDHVRHRAWYYLAKISFQGGYLEPAQDYLQQINGKAEEYIYGDQRLLLAQVLMAKGEFFEAAKLLQAWRGPEDLTPYAQYNLGIALIRSEQQEEGLRILQRLGEINTHNEEQEALRDRANLSLAYALFKNDESAKARIYLQRVRLHGPHSNMALLLAGWADAELNSHDEAVVPWTELKGREMADASVQESLLTLPFAYVQLNAHAKAAGLYQEAIDAYTVELARLDTAIDAIQQGRLIEELKRLGRLQDMGWFWWPQDLPNLPQQHYLIQLVADHEFQGSLKNFLDLEFIQRNLADWRQGIETFDDMLHTRKQRYAIHLPRAEQLMSEVNLSAIGSQRDTLAERLAMIERKDDTLALMTSKEHGQWSALEHIEHGIEQNRVPAQQEKLQQRHRMLKGVLIWRINDAYPIRLWEHRKQLQKLDDAIERTHLRQESLQGSVEAAPMRFEGFGDRIVDSKKRIEELLPRVSIALEAQGQHLKELAMDEFEHRKQRLILYLEQAHFGLASTYDYLSSGAQQ